MRRCNTTRKLQFSLRNVKLWTACYPCGNTVGIIQKQLGFPIRSAATEGRAHRLVAEDDLCEGAGAQGFRWLFLEFKHDTSVGRPPSQSGRVLITRRPRMDSEFTFQCLDAIAGMFFFCYPQ